jgi:hypothetical protein
MSKTILSHELNVKATEREVFSSQEGIFHLYVTK